MRLLVCHREVGSHRERKRKPKAPEKKHIWALAREWRKETQEKKKQEL